MKPRGTGLAAATLALVTVAAGCSATEPPDTGPAPLPTPAATRTPPPPLGWGPTREEFHRAAGLVGAMSVAEQAGQVLVADYPSVAAAQALVRDLHLGGVIAMGENVSSADRLRADIASLQAATDRAYPLVIGVDQEGGRVARIGAPVTEFPPS